MRWSVLAIVTLVSGSALQPAAADTANSLLSVDHRRLVARADITLVKPVERSEHGLPVGNGRMGSLVWTTPTAVHCQINRVDLFPFNSYSGIGRRRVQGWVRKTDYCGGAGAVAIDFGGEVFPASATRQHLSLYDAQETIEGRGVTLRILAWYARDVMAIEIEDRRAQPQPICVNLSMLRPPLVKSGKHVAESKLGTKSGRIAVTQTFTEPASTGILEGDHYAGSAVVIGTLGREGQAEPAGETTVRLTLPARKGVFTVLIGSAATFDRKQDVAAAAVAELKAAAANGYQGLFRANRTWWHEFWAKSSVRLHSKDGTAERLEQIYKTFLYVMGSSSRGKYPPKFNGMIWSTNGDDRAWGAQFWWWNQQTFYRAPMPANHLELMSPMFDLYSGMYEAQALAARQQWGTKGIYLPETVSYNGLERLPDTLAAELRDLLLERKPWEEMSPAFKQHMQTVDVLSSRWNFLLSGVPPYSYVEHIFSSGAKIAYLYWQKYEYTLDERWLRERAYPMLKGVAEFYRNYPNVKKAADGKYHIYNVNNQESIWGGQDTHEEVAAMHGILPLAIRASQILNVDADMRPIWQELLDNLRPLPMGNEPDALPFDPALRIWAPGLKPSHHGRGGPTLRPCTYYDLWTLETDNPEMTRIAQATFEHRGGYGSVLAGKPTGPLSEICLEAAMLGRAPVVKAICTAQVLKYPLMLPNRLALDEMAQSQNVEMIGNLSTGLQLALLQSIPPGPAQPPVLRVFPAWPREWDAAFRLLARGGFLVSSSMENGRIEFVEILSQLGGECRMRNPWPDAAITLYRNGGKAEEVSGSLVIFRTAREETITVVPKGSTPSRKVIP